jgi:REP element-mobilizing transposase RayT
MAYWRLYYHFVWGTKDRLALIDDQIEARVYSAIAAKAQELGALVHAVGGMEDHVHLVASVPPKIPLSEFIGLVKGNSSHFVNHVIVPGFHFAWQGEYGVQSFSEKDLPVVVGYVKNQKEHHLEGRTRERLEQVD